MTSMTTKSMTSGFYKTPEEEEYGRKLLQKFLERPFSSSSLDINKARRYLDYAIEALQEEEMADGIDWIQKAKSVLSP